MTKAEKENILAWMNKQIGLNESLKAIENYDNEISVLNYGFGNEIHIYKGLRKLAEAAGTDIMWRAATDYQKPRYYVPYKEYVFFSHILPEEELCI